MKKTLNTFADVIIVVSAILFFPMLICAVWLEPTMFYYKLLFTNFLFLAFGAIMHHLFEDHGCEQQKQCEKSNY